MSNVSQLSATEAHASRIADVRATLARLENFLAKRETLDAESLHWGHVGDLTEAADRLEALCKFLSA